MREKFDPMFRYSRCGRTDRGVSAFGQVIGLQMRRTPASLDIVHTLNRLLPQDIRVLSWAPVAKHFNARYDCLYRTYKYFFPREVRTRGLNHTKDHKPLYLIPFGEGYTVAHSSQNLNIEAMRQAAQQYVGDHDYRNFCKMDTVNVANFRRVVLSVDISRSSNVSPIGPSPYELYEYVIAMLRMMACPAMRLSPLVLRLLISLHRFTVCGYAFLWHQVRCMVEVLFRVGRGEESPDIVSKLLDPTSFVRGKPVYALASELPLVLWECGFEDIEWRHSDEASRWIDDVFTSRWREQAMRYGLAQAFRVGLDQSTVQVGGKVCAWSERKLELPSSVRKPGPKLLDGPRERACPILMCRQLLIPHTENYEEKVATMSDKKRQQFEAKRQNMAGDDDE